jgi:putative ABC transport system permease protein
MSLEDFNLLISLPQIKRNESGEPLVSPECIQQARVTAGEYTDRPATVRGVRPIVFEVNRQLRVVAGDKPSGGRNVMVGTLTHTALGVPREQLAIGSTIAFAGDEWTVVGHFSAGGTAMDGEILADLNDVMAMFARDTYSGALIKLQDASEAPLLIRSLNSRNDIRVKAIAEQEYYRELAEGVDRVIFLALFLGLIAAIGGLVSGMGTMYASVLGRVREIGTLKTLGYSPGAIVRSFVAESVAICLIGALIGGALAMQVDGVSAKFLRGAVSLTVDHRALLAGLGVALMIGVLGALPPALKGARMRIQDALGTV